MTRDDCEQLKDVYSDDLEKEPRPTQYVLQFLWRDMSSNFDVMGPYYCLERSLNHKLLMNCMFETIRCMEAYGFLVNGLVCDGASENLSLIKCTMNTQGAFGHTQLGGTLNFDINPSFQNPFDLTRTIFWVICPTHRLKNMIAALYSSRQGAPKNLLKNGIHFGWQTIVDMKKREYQRVKNGQL
jgi:hypothetical protein